MKKHNNLFSKIIDYDNIVFAHLNAKKGKNYYSEVKEVDKDIDSYLGKLQFSLLGKNFTTSKYETFTITEPKERIIYKLPYIPDRIVHHAIMQVLQPIWDKIFIFDSYAAVPGKGIHAGYYRLKQFLKNKENTKYCLKLDIEKFYPNIDHNILFSLVKMKIKCKDTLWLLEDIIRSVSGNKGLPIGNYLSQYLSNIYLNYFDHWIKETIGCKYYLRYCDDAVILYKNKGFLNWLLEKIRFYLWNHLKLKLNKKSQIFPVESRGIDFLGYKTYHQYSLLRKSSYKKFKQKIDYIKQNYNKLKSKHIVSSIMSYVGWLIHCDSYNLLNKYIYKDEIILNIIGDVSRKLNLKRNPIDRFLND